MLGNITFYRENGEGYFSLAGRCQRRADPLQELYTVPIFPTESQLNFRWEYERD